MGPLGFEPRTSRLSAVRSNQAEPRAPYLIHVYLIFKIAFIVVQMLDQFSSYLYLYFQGNYPYLFIGNSSRYLEILQTRGYPKLQKWNLTGRNTQPWMFSGVLYPLLRSSISGQAVSFPGRLSCVLQSVRSWIQPG